MNNIFSLQQKCRTSSLDANLISRQYKQSLMADFMRMKYKNPELKQSQIESRLGYSTSTLQRYRNDINMLPPYRIQPNNTNKRAKKTSNTSFDNISHRDPVVKRPRLTSNDLKPTSKESSHEVKPVKNKNKIKGGLNTEINEKHLDEIVHKSYLLMDLAIQKNANDKTVRSDTAQDLQEFNNQFLATQTKKGRQLVSMLPAIKKALSLLGDDIVDLSTENDALKIKKVDCIGKWFQKSKDKPLKQIEDEKIAILVMSRMKRQMNKQQ